MRTRILTFSFLLFSCLSLVAQQNEYQGHLWKISGNGLDQPSFLYGTMHVSNKVAFHLSDSFYRAIASVDVVALEINPETWMETMTSDKYIADQMGNAFSMRGDYSNTGFYKAIFELPSPENTTIGQALGQELGILNSLLYRTSNYNAEFQEDTYLDLFIYQAGRKQGKEITGLEQLGLTMRLNEQAAQPITDKEERKRIKEENERRRHELKKLLDGKSFGEVMEDAYRRGDLDLLDTISRLSTTDDRYHDLIIVYRNAEMAKSMDSIMRSGKKLFAGVGAAHLPNSYGMINLLRQKGYTVTAVDRTKTKYGRNTKDRLENTFLTHAFKHRTAFDGSFQTHMPGPLYEFPESNNVMMAAYPDMANGATYVVTRILTYAPLHGLSQKQYMDKIDSLLFENIPGKIEEKERKNINGYPTFYVLNKTKKGDYQRYHIVVSPIEVLIFKIAGKKAYVKHPEVDAFINQLTFNNEKANQWSTYSPCNTAYQVSMPGNMMYEAENSAFSRGFWRKNVQSFDPADQSYFGVMNRSYSDMRFMEEDSFELRQMSLFFTEQFDYEIKDWSYDTFLGRNSLNALAVKDNAADLQLRFILKSEQYYLLFAQCDDQAKRERFFSSFRFDTFTYQRPFELQRDTQLYYNVLSPVEKNKRNTYYNRYRDEDESYKEQVQNATYYNRETDESIYVKYTKFHKYAFEKHIDSVWADQKESLTNDGAFYVRTEKQWNDEDMQGYEVEVSDTNSSRNIKARYILKGGVLYCLKTELEQDRPTSRFIETFFNSFEPWDTAIGTSILANKTTQFLEDLLSEDSLTHEAAYNSITKVNFEDEDAPKLIEAIQKRYKAEHDVSIRGSLLTELGWLEHDAVLPYFKEKYKAVGDTMKFQLAILRGVALHRTKKSARMFLKMLKEETPLSKQTYMVSKVFYPFLDTIVLAKELYPGLFMFSSLPEYKRSVYWYLARLKDSGYVSKRVYRRKVKHMAWEANNDAKRQKSEEAGMATDYYDQARRYERYNYSSSLYNYAVLLHPYKKRSSSVRKFFKRLDEINSPGLRLDMAVLKAKNGEVVHDSVWRQLAANDNDRIALYRALKEADLLHLFPTEYSNQTDLALSLFADINTLNATRDSVRYIDRVLTQIDGDTGYVYFFKSKGKYSDDWEIGYLALLTQDTSKVETTVLFTDEDMKYTKFEDLDLQMEMQIRTLQMKRRKRYRVSDEEKFKVLNSGRSYYY